MTKEFIKLNNLVAWIVWAIACFTFCSTIEPTASFWDCGEYIACAYKLEVGHPPGAPFFLIIGRIFTLFGGGDPTTAAMMINVMSALVSAFAVMFAFWTITRLGSRIYLQSKTQVTKAQEYAVLGAGAIGALACAFSDTVWFNAVEGEVYAFSLFFTSAVFWAILKWDAEDSVNPVGALRWIVLISFLIGVSIGVHLLSLLAIPAMVFTVYFKKYKFSWKGFGLTGVSAVLILALVQNLIIPKVVKFVADYEIFFTNKMHFSYNTGTILYFILLCVSITAFVLYTTSKKEKHYKIGFYSAIIFSGVAVISSPSGSGMLTRLVSLGAMIYFIHKYKSKTITLNTIFLSLATLLIGYSTFFILVIRSSANTPMDENDPENAPNMLSYLLREQYGDWPLLYGPYYNAPTLARSEFGSGDPLYAKDEANKNYKVSDSRKNSIAKYEKEYCTLFPRMWSSQSHHVTGYRYWGNVAEHHRNKMVENRNGESETEEIPTFGANMIYFFSYQINFMYLRYFYWNFVGRQNDIQGTTGNNMEGNWISGIKGLDDYKLDYNTANPIYRDKNNLANNKYFALPFLLGLLGMFFHFKKSKPDAWIVMCFFLFTGLSIVFYLNQQPYQPRERDYAYVGSFYAFTIWIGLGVLYLFDLFSKKTNTMASAVLATTFSLVVPGIMVSQNWDDHNRGLRTLSRDCAIDYLQSCAPNAIIFTNGDNDTFPLWYAQEVEGVRTDVRVVNLSLLNTDWYIKQMRRATYEGKSVPFTIPAEKLEAEKMSYLILNGQSTTPMKLSDAVTFAYSDDPNNKYDNGGDLIDIIPSKNFYVDVDSMQVMKNKVIDVKDTNRLVKRITWDLGGRNYVTKADYLVLDLIAHNNWERPIYFAVTTGDEAYLGLKKYFQLEGLAYRFVPIKQTESEEAMGGRVNTEGMYNNIVNKFLWGGQDKKGINLDENCVRMTGNLRMQMGILASALIAEGKKDKAKKILDLCLEKMPDENISYDATIYSICIGYYEIGDFASANKLARKLFSIFEGDLRIYESQIPRRKYAYGREINQSKELMKRLTGLAQQYQQDEVYKEFLEKLQTLLSPEDINPTPKEKVMP